MYAIESCEKLGQFPRGYLDRRGGRVVRWCWVNFQCRGILLNWTIVEQGLTALTVGMGEDICSFVYHFSSSSFSLGDGPI